MINVQVIGLSKLQKIAEQYPAVSQKYIDQAIQASLVRILGAEKQEAPFGVSGNLRDVWKIKTSPFSGTLTSNAPYAADVNYGTGPHVVPVAQITPWANKKGLNPWAVAKSIAKKGTKANPFFDRAIADAVPGIQKEFQTAMDGAIDEVSSYTD